ncbi:MAG: hypothetical protein NTX50_30245 [Candidatus Sumerlaeota bacterium]|nr:hypothetical protein [Candidatus Sumerlaeota bacterium]
MADGSFAGDKKKPMRSPLAAIEKWFIQSNVHRFPQWIEGRHLTLLTIIWSFGMILFGALAGYTHWRHWLWGSSAMLFLQWFTDSFDGSLGRYRNAGLIRWGYCMDHFLDFIFMSCIFVGYLFLFMGDFLALLGLIALMIIYQAMMVNSWLTFAATNEFKITYLGVGPTEVRLFFAIINTIIIYAGATWVLQALPYTIAVSFAALIFIVWRDQRRIWYIDLAIKRQQECKMENEK